MLIASVARIFQRDHPARILPTGDLSRRVVLLFRQRRDDVSLSRRSAVNGFGKPHSRLEKYHSKPDHDRQDNRHQLNPPLHKLPLISVGFVEN
jgi:hypothetical protein